MNDQKLILEFMIPDVINGLRRLHTAIEKWAEIARLEFDAFRTDAEIRRNAAWDEYGYNPISDEVFLLLNTERVMLANLAVTIDAAAENFVITICKIWGITYLTKKGQPNAKIACENLQEHLKVDLFTLPGSSGNNRARLLGNCFKHHERKMDEKLANVLGGKVGDEIEYEEQDWEGMISDTKTVLEEIVKRLS